MILQTSSKVCKSLVIWKVFIHIYLSVCWNALNLLLLNLVRVDIRQRQPCFFFVCTSLEWETLVLSHVPQTSLLVSLYARVFQFALCHLEAYSFCHCLFSFLFKQNVIIFKCCSENKTPLKSLRSRHRSINNS